MSPLAWTIVGVAVWLLAGVPVGMVIGGAIRGRDREVSGE
jgi:hypothetical protein